jgi:hypothetical protein
MKTFSQFAAIVEFLVKELGRDLDAAIREAQVPQHLVEQVRSYIAGPVDIVSPGLLVQKQTIRLCEQLADNAPQPYTSGFRTFLLDVRKWNRQTVDSLDATVSNLICRLPNPSASEKYQQRGLVIGYIQSGKTAAMAALIARAADQGYKLVIVLAGLMNDLRAQTQRRLDQEIAGSSENPEADSPYVTHDPAAAKWSRLTNSGLTGDFRAGTHNDLNPATPKLAVVKKNVKVLNRFTQWLQKSPVPLAQLPALIIDDEADQASINTNYGRLDDEGEEIDPSKTNKAIRELLAALPKCAYVGFTATPFANVLIDASVEADLYPRDFIAALPEPIGYFGPRQLFGLGMSSTSLTPEPREAPALDVICHIKEEELKLLDELAPGGDCPPSLAKALLAFLLSSSARLARGHDRQHFTMFVHPSQSTEDHKTFAGVLRDELQLLRMAVNRPKQFPNLAQRAKELWETDFLKVIAAQPAHESHPADFETVWKFAKSVADAIDIKVLNYGSDDELDYSDPPKRYLVVGGNRLSRGLTLEGLSVSFFTRDTSYYDTLLQMGRWFGYRPGYVDLTRIFVEQRMADQFADLARVELELRADITKYARQPDPPTPLELKPKIRTHPSLAVTSRLKMGAGGPMNISFQNTDQQTVSFPLGDKNALRRNEDAARDLVKRLGKPTISTTPEGMHIWKGVSAGTVIDFVEAYAFGREAPVVNRDNLSKYIRRQNAKGELRGWDIVIPRGNRERDPYTWAGDVHARRVIRTPTTTKSIRVLSSPGDIESWKKAAGRKGDDSDLGCLMLYAIDKNSGTEERSFFASSTKATDIIGLVFIFPDSHTDVTVEYVSQQG